MVEISSLIIRGYIYEYLRRENGNYGYYSIIEIIVMKDRRVMSWTVRLSSEIFQVRIQLRHVSRFFPIYLLYKLWRYFWNSLVQGDEWRWNNNNRKYEAWKEEVTTHDKKRDEKSKKIMESGVEEVSKISTRERLDYDSIKIVHFLRRILRRMICSISERIRSVINYKLGDGFRGYLEDLLQSQVEQH